MPVKIVRRNTMPVRGVMPLDGHLLCIFKTKGWSKTTDTATLPRPPFLLQTAL